MDSGDLCECGHERQRHAMGVADCRCTRGSTRCDCTAFVASAGCITGGPVDVPVSYTSATTVAAKHAIIERFCLLQKAVAEGPLDAQTPADCICTPTTARLSSWQNHGAALEWIEDAVAMRIAKITERPFAVVRDEIAAMHAERMDVEHPGVKGAERLEDESRRDDAERRADWASAAILGRDPLEGIRFEDMAFEAMRDALLAITATEAYDADSAATKLRDALSMLDDSGSHVKRKYADRGELRQMQERVHEVEHDRDGMVARLHAAAVEAARLRDLLGEAHAAREAAEAELVKRRDSEFAIPWINAGMTARLALGGGFEQPTVVVKSIVEELAVDVGDGRFRSEGPVFIVRCLVVEDVKPSLDTLVGDVSFHITTTKGKDALTALVERIMGTLAGADEDGAPVPREGMEDAFEQVERAYDMLAVDRPSDQPPGSCDECWGLSFHRDECSQSGPRPPWRVGDTVICPKPERPDELLVGAVVGSQGEREGWLCVREVDCGPEFRIEQAKVVRRIPYGRGALVRVKGSGEDIDHPWIGHVHQVTTTGVMVTPSNKPYIVVCEFDQVELV